MKKILGVVLSLVAAVIVMGCQKTSTSVPQNANTLKLPDVIKIGVIAPLSGPAATYGEDVVHGYKYIAQKVNDAGGINGSKIELIFEDGKCDGKDATTAVQKLINVDQVEVIAGGQCSSETIPAGKIAQQYGVTLVSPLSSAPEISTIGDYVFRYWNDLDAGGVMADYLASEGAKKIALVYENTDYSVAFANVVKTEFQGEVLMDQKFNSDEKDFSIIAKSIVEIGEDIDFLVVISQTEATAISLIKAIDGEGKWESLKEKFIATETVITDTVIAELGDKVNGIRGVRLPGLNEMNIIVQQNAEPVLAGYSAKTADIFVLLAADSLQLIIDGITKVGYDGTLIRDYITSLNQTNPRQSFIGPIRFDAEGDVQGLRFAVVKIEEGEITTIQ